MAFSKPDSIESLVSDDEDESKEEELIIDYIMNELTDNPNCFIGTFANFKKPPIRGPFVN